MDLNNFTALWHNWHYWTFINRITLFFFSRLNVAIDQKQTCNICTITGMTNILSIIIPPLPVCSHTSPFSCHLCVRSLSFLLTLSTWGEEVRSVLLWHSYCDEVDLWAGLLSFHSFPPVLINQASVKHLALCHSCQRDTLGDEKKPTHPKNFPLSYWNILSSVHSPSTKVVTCSCSFFLCVSS